MMETGNISTPFGRRSISLAEIRRQRAVSESRAVEGAVDKWKVLRDASAAVTLLGIQSNSVAVLDALISFYPESEFRSDAQLIVFPSNMQLSLRAHGMPSSTMRRHLALLVDAGLIIRKDSANGKSVTPGRTSLGLLSRRLDSIFPLCSSAPMKLPEWRKRSWLSGLH